MMSPEQFYPLFVITSIIVAITMFAIIYYDGDDDVIISEALAYEKTMLQEYKK